MKRYRINDSPDADNWIAQDDNGVIVLYKDVVALEAEVEQLKKELEWLRMPL
jgi:hypothetical protein